MAPNLLVSGGDVFLSWLEPSSRRDGGTRSTRLRVARLGESGWSAPSTIASGEKVVANWADFPSLGAGNDGSLFAHWAESSGEGPYAYDVGLASSADRGITWARVGVANDDRLEAEHGFVSMAADGALRAFWLDGRKMAGGGHDHADRGAAMALRTAIVSSGAVAPSEELDARVCDCCQTSAAVASSGPVVVYRDRGEDETRDISIVRLVDDRWTAPRSVYADGWRVPGCPVNGPKVVARGRDVAVAWYTYAGSVPRIRLAFSRTGGAEFSPPVEVDTSYGGDAPIGRVDLALLDGDQVVVSWLVSARENARWQARRVAFDGRMGTTVVLAYTRADRESGFPRLVRAGDALVASWTDPRSPSRVRARRLSLDRLPADLQVVAEVSAQAAPDREVDGQPPLDVRATAADGTAVSLRHLSGRPVLLNLWATWCEPCRHELPELAALHEKFRSTDLRVIALSVDRERTRDEVVSFAARRKLPFEIWHDPEDRASATLGTSLLPTSYLIGRDGKVLWKHSGALAASDPEVVAAIERALRK